MDSTSPPVVGIVTPVYNGAPYLEECIQSVLDQTYANWRYTIFDNCSTDGSYEIAQRYAAQDPRITVVRADKFLEQVPNFNRCIQLAAAGSKFTKMLLADDWMFLRCVEEMVKVAELNPRVGVVGSFSMYRDRVHHHGLPFSRTPVFPGRWTSRQYIFHDHNFIGSPTAVMFRSDLVRARDPFFSEDTPAEDVEGCLELLAESDFGFVFQLLTFNRRDNEGSWSAREDLSPDMLNDYLLAYRLGPEFLDPADYKARMAEMNDRYYAMLGRALVARRGAEFWEFHNKWLTRNAIMMDRARVWREAARHLVGLALNLKSTLRRWRRSRS